MVKKIVYGVHTGEVEHRITRKEMEQVKVFFNLSPNDPLCNTSYFYKQGINQIVIEETVKRYGGQEHIQYKLVLRLNFSRCIGGGDYVIMPLTVRNVKKVITRVNRILQKVLQLNVGNGQLEDWTIRRLDSAFDIYIDQPELLAVLLNLSLQLPAKQKSSYSLQTNTEQFRQQIQESVCFGNDSYDYNIYVKLVELMKQGRVLTDDERASLPHLFRVERQNHEGALKKMLGASLCFGELEDISILESIKTTMIQDMKTYFGTGNFYSVEKLRELFATQGTDYIKYKIELNNMVAGGLCWQQNYSAGFLSFLKQNGIAPAIIAQPLVQKYQVEELQGIYNMITSVHPLQKKREYHAFPVPCTKSDGRKSVVLSLPSVANYPSNQESVAGATLEQLEEKIYKKVTENYLVHRRYMQSANALELDVLARSVEYVLNFRRVVQTEAVKISLDTFIQIFQLDSKQQGKKLKRTKSREVTLNE